MRQNLKKKLPKLFEAQSFQEAIQILGARKASPIYNQLVEMAYKVKDDTGKVRENMLREAETHLQKDEQNLIGNQMKENVIEEAASEGAGGKETGTGKTGQADGRETGDVKPPGEGSHPGSEPAQAQTGTSQLVTPISEAIDQVADMGSVDPMNTAVIDYIDDGMSKVEAQNAASKDSNMMEAIFDIQFKKHMLPILKKMQATMVNASEAIIAVDNKFEGAKSGGIELQNGFQETNTSLPVDVHPKVSRIDEKSIEETRSDITQKYLSDETIYN